MRHVTQLNRPTLTTVSFRTKSITKSSNKNHFASWNLFLIIIKEIL